MATVVVNMVGVVPPRPTVAQDVKMDLVIVEWTIPIFQLPAMVENVDQELPSVVKATVVVNMDTVVKRLHTVAQDVKLDLVNVEHPVHLLPLRKPPQLQIKLPQSIRIFQPSLEIHNVDQELPSVVMATVVVSMVGVVPPLPTVA